MRGTGDLLIFPGEITAITTKADPHDRDKCEKCKQRDRDKCEVEEEVEDLTDFVVYTTAAGMVCVHYGKGRKTLERIKLVTVIHHGKHFLHTDAEEGDICVKHFMRRDRVDVMTLLNIVSEEHYQEVIRYLAYKGMKL